MLIQPRGDRVFLGRVRHGKAGVMRLTLPTVASLTPDDWLVTIHDARLDPVDFDADVDLVGVTGMTNEIPHAYSIADKFREKGKTVVMGGVHVTALPEEALQHCDAVVVGEAEYVWESALRDFEAGELKRVYKADRFFDMREMKWPRRDLVDRNIYSTFYSLEATRGCPFDCDYCAVTGVFGRKYRRRPVDDVIREIASFDAKRFFFVDDNICGTASYAKELFRALIPLKKDWGAQTSIALARDEELLELYAAAGGRYAFIGFESIVPGNLEAVNKKWTKNTEYAEAIKRIHDAGINILGSFMVGLDEDDPSMFQRTLDFIMENNIDAPQFHIVTPLPGTRYYNWMESQGRIIDRDWSRYGLSDVVFQPAKMTQQQLQDGFNWIFRESYTLKNALKRSFRDWRGIPYRLLLCNSYRNKTKRLPEADLQSFIG